MPTIGDVYNQLVTANTNLAQIDADINTLNTTDTNGFATLNTTDTNGSANLSTILQAISRSQQYASQALYHISLQDDTIICILEHISQQTCALLNEAHMQTELQTEIRNHLARLTEIAKIANPGAEVEAERLEKLRQKIDECCPTEEPPPPCQYQRCPAPDPLQPPEGSPG